MRALEAARILSAISSVYSRMPLWIEIFGLVTKSTAPSSSARMVISEPRSVSEDTITTGIGRSRISFSRKSRPSIFGISTSSVSTSGLVCLISSRATSGSGATPTTSMSGWLLIISVMTLRISAESSTIRTLIFIAIFRALPFESRSEQVDIAADRRHLEAAGVIELALDQRVVMGLHQLLDQHLAGAREEVDLARVDVVEVFGDHADFFHLQKIAARRRHCVRRR